MNIPDAGPFSEHDWTAGTTRVSALPADSTSHREDQGMNRFVKTAGAPEWRNEFGTPGESRRVDFADGYRALDADDDIEGFIAAGVVETAGSPTRC